MRSRACAWKTGRPGRTFRIGWLRSVANIYHGFAVQSFTDELAHRAGRDPVDYLLDLIGPARMLDSRARTTRTMEPPSKPYPWETGRLRRVTEIGRGKGRVGEAQAGQGRRAGHRGPPKLLDLCGHGGGSRGQRPGRGSDPARGYRPRRGPDREPGGHPRPVRSAAVFGASIVRSGEITAKNGVIQQSNFNDYPVARIKRSALTRTNVHIVDSSAPPAGVGEPGVPPFVAAVTPTELRAPKRQFPNPLPVAARWRS